MFKGNNTLTLNEATMIVAMQEYLDARAKEGIGPKVISVKGSSGVESTFIIMTSETKGDTL